MGGLCLSGSVWAQEIINVCNNSGTDMRLARFSITGPFLSLDCSHLSTTACSAKLYNWQIIRDGWCEEYYPEALSIMYFAIQLKDRDGSWYSTSYEVDEEFLAGTEKGLSGLRDRYMCVKDDTYSTTPDRVIKGRWKEVSDEVCKLGYSKVRVNALARTENNVRFTANVRPQPPLAKAPATPPVAQEQPKKQATVKPNSKKKRVTNNRKP